MKETIFFIIHTVIIFWIAFYYGTIYGEGVFRCCRYLRLKFIRWTQGRHKYNDKIVLGK